MLTLFAAVSLFVPAAQMFAGSLEGLAVNLLRMNGDTDHVERAAFLVRDERGALDLVHWPVPARGVYRAAHWNGPLPARVLGVIHTHPWQLPRPSRQDEQEARHLAIPFYVISRTSLCVTDGHGMAQCERIRTWGALPDQEEGGSWPRDGFTLTADDSLLPRDQALRSLFNSAP